MDSPQPLYKGGNLEIWAIVLENKDESGGEVKAVGFVRSNLLKRTKSLKKDAKAWQKVAISKIELLSESEALINFAVDHIVKGVK